MKISKKIILTALVSAVALSAAGCKDKQVSGDGSTITWWVANQAAPIVKSYDEIAAIQKVQEKLGIDIEFFHPSTQQETEQFNIMAASGDFKDIVSYNWNGYVGGPVKAANDGAILVLDDYVEKYMPNLSKKMAENPDINYQARGYDGSICVVPSFTDNLITGAVFGPQIRKDWLDKLGLEVPESIDDWYNVLTAFKTKDPNGNGQADEIPFAADGLATFMRFSRAFGGVEDDFYISEDGKIEFGFIEPEFKEFIAEMNKWYKEGLIDPEYAAADSSNLDAKMITNIGGAYIGYSGSAMSKYLVAGRAENPDYQLVAAQWPTHNGGKPYCGYNYQKFYGTPGRGMALAATNKNVEKSLEFIDYFYGDEGSTLINWGIEGETYTKTEDGLAFTDLIMNNPENKSPVEAITSYALTQYSLVMLRSDAFMALNTAFDEQRNAMELWNKSDLSRIMPTFAISPDEQSQITKVMDDIYMYRNEWIHKLVMGVEPIDKWDEVAAKIREMGIDKAINVYQTAYERYINQ